MSENEVLRPEADEEAAGENSVETDIDAHEAEASGEEANENPVDEAEILRSEIEELRNQLLRKQADFENFRKRINREKQESVQFSNQQLILDLVTVIDDFERAIKSADDSRDYDAFHDGIVIIEKQLTGMLERKWGLTRFDSEGESFNPQRHQAVASEDAVDEGEPVVLEEYQKGYLLHDRVVRSAKVKVSKPKEE